MSRNKFPDGWYENKVQWLLAHYGEQTEDEAGVETKRKRATYDVAGRQTAPFAGHRMLCAAILVDLRLRRRYRKNLEAPVTITVDIRPEVQAELARQAAARGRAIEAHAATLLEDAVHLPAERLPRRTGQELIDACAKVRGLLTNEEVDTLFSRNPSSARPVDFE
jgi:hypothetical protein